MRLKTIVEEIRTRAAFLRDYGPVTRKVVEVLDELHTSLLRSLREDEAVRTCAIAEIKRADGVIFEGRGFVVCPAHEMRFDALHEYAEHVLTCDAYRALVLEPEPGEVEAMVNTPLLYTPCAVCQRTGPIAPYTGNRKLLPCPGCGRGLPIDELQKNKKNDPVTSRPA